MVRNSEIKINEKYQDLESHKTLTVLGFRYHGTEKWAYTDDGAGNREEVELYRLKRGL